MKKLLCILFFMTSFSALAAGEAPKGKSQTESGNHVSNASALGQTDKQCGYDPATGKCPDLCVKGSTTRSNGADSTGISGGGTTTLPAKGKGM